MNCAVSVDLSAGGTAIVVEFSDETLATYTVEELTAVRPGSVQGTLPISQGDAGNVSR